MINVVYPLIPGWAHQDFEFKHSLRSLEENLSEDFSVTVVGRYLPLWVKPYSINFITTDTGRSKEALKKAAWHFFHEKEFLWMNDDIYIMKHTTLDDLRVKLYQKDFSKMPQDREMWKHFKGVYEVNKQAGAAIARQHGMTKWKRRIRETLDILEDKGYSLFDYSTHSPYLFNPQNLLTLEGNFPGVFTSDHVVETAYYNCYNPDWENRLITQSDWLGAYSKEQGNLLKIDRSRFINHNDEGLTEDLKKRILHRFPNKSRFEK